LRREFGMGSLPIIAADVSSAACGLLCADTSWMQSSEAWRALLQQASSTSSSKDNNSRDRTWDERERPSASLQGSVGASLRELVMKKRAEGRRYVVLYAVRDERPFLLKL
jgi:translation initiation factor 2-alpha kinase 4